MSASVTRTAFEHDRSTAPDVGRPRGSPGTALGETGRSLQSPTSLMSERHF